MRHPHVIILTDRWDRSRQLADIVRTISTCEVVSCRDGMPACRSAEGIIADLRLDRPESKRVLAAAVGPDLPSTVPLVMLLRPSGGTSLRDAIECGATACFSETADPRTLVSALFRQIAPHRTMIDLLVQHSVSRTADLLADMFNAARSGTVDTNRIEAGIDPVIEAVRDGGLRRWLDTVQVHDEFTLRHCLLVAGVTAHFGLYLGLSERDRSTLIRAALVHDIGKVFVPREILQKPGPLDAEEMKVIRTHPTVGHALLVASGMTEPITLAATLQHHELLDGTGYPSGLKSSEIGDSVRLLTICDIAAALIEHRPYRLPMQHTEALEILRSMAGHGLESALVEAFASSLATVEWPSVQESLGGQIDRSSGSDGHSAACPK